MVSVLDSLGLHSGCLGLGLGLASFVLEFTHTSTKEGITKRLRLFYQVMNSVQCTTSIILKSDT